ncbi:tubulin-like doman-containing protein [Streptomyces sp. NBC_01538]|uniref:tubulin-like doman-containing protein n=1 Tax=Streptomyces sp. NBC_01538 TaxID=2903897 RepID=UPI003870CE99
MKIFQPMLFVGLGGTGGLVGAELERRLRAELCGPDGSALQGRLSGNAPYQLPDCLQFVYADYSESDLMRLPQFNVDPSLRAAFSRTSRATHDLLPNFDSSPEVTKMLRASMRGEVADWLPPRNDEPRVTPLHNGAGQLPTVGRAALFATLRHGLNPVLTPLLQAIDAMARAGGELAELGGGKVTGCDVFVAFSVAGGTGAGIFLDYLHLINHAFQLRRFNGVKIYPLVVMPSSFTSATGGGREAELNAARALVDLFRLVDGQNAPTEGAEIGDLDQSAGLGVRYPGTQPIRLRTGILPTSFLFSPTAGIRADDLRRSIVSLVMSLIGTELGDTRTRGRSTVGDDDFQTFAASFINRGVHRSALSPTGIGRQGVSTSLVASMTVPKDQLADLVAGRMLREAVSDLVDRPRTSLRETTVPMIRQLFADSHLEELWERRQLPVLDPEPLPRGGRAVETALGERISDMQRLLADLRGVAERSAATMADRFSPRPAIDKLLLNVDPFHADRVVRGVPATDTDDPIARLGFLGMLDSRSRAPGRPAGMTDQPPKIPRIKGRLAGMSPARWGDDDVQAALQEQDAWYQWRCRTIWHEAWREQQQHWRAPADTAGADIARLVNAFRAHSDQERKVSAQKGLELYEDRTGISYLLPPQRTLNHFYEDLVARLIRREGLRETEDAAALLLKLVDGETWRDVHNLSRRSPDGAVSVVKAQLEGRITRLFAEGGERLEERPLLPSMSTLLAAAAGDSDATDQVSKEALDLFGRKLTGLLPVGFTPEGTGPLRVLVTYPRVEAVDEVEQYLGKALRLPSDARNSVEYRGVESDSVTVVLFRSEMSLTQVPEARKVLRQWARAKDNEQAQDVLRWRQRLGYRDSWMVSGEEDRRVILHRLLCCMWNGQVDVVDGESASPDRVRLRLHPEQGPQVPGVRLRLGDFPGGVSSWAELLRAYERWTVLDDERTVEDYCRELMGAQPTGLTRSGSDPHPLFTELVDKIAPRQLELLAERRERDGERVEGWVRPLWEFWAETLPAALDTEFGDQRAVQPTLRTLLEHVRGDTPTARRRPLRETPRRPAEDEDDWGTTPGRTPDPDKHRTSADAHDEPYAGRRGDDGYGTTRDHGGSSRPSGPRRDREDDRYDAGGYGGNARPSAGDRDDDGYPNPGGYSASSRPFAGDPDDDYGTTGPRSGSSRSPGGAGTRRDRDDAGEYGGGSRTRADDIPGSRRDPDEGYGTTGRRGSSSRPSADERDADGYANTGGYGGGSRPSAEDRDDEYGTTGPRSGSARSDGGTGTRRGHDDDRYDAGGYGGGSRTPADDPDDDYGTTRPRSGSSRSSGDDDRGRDDDAGAYHDSSRFSVDGRGSRGDGRVNGSPYGAESPSVPWDQSDDGYERRDGDSSPWDGDAQ